MCSKSYDDVEIASRGTGNVNVAGQNADKMQATFSTTG
jgi:hypothetical protein